jgi:Bcl-2 antagonist/killer family protein
MSFGPALHVVQINFDCFIFRLFIDGTINWGRIITLLTFGYRMAMNVLSTGIRGFFSKIVKFVVDFIIKEKIAKWIAEQGGWVSKISLQMFCGVTSSSARKVR